MLLILQRRFEGRTNKYILQMSNFYGSLDLKGEQIN